MSLFALPVTVADLLQLQTGIQFFTNQAEAVAEAANINSPGATETVYSYAVKLLSANISLSQVAMAVDSLMYGVTDNVAELTKLSTQFLPPQVATAIANGYNPTVFAAEALGLGLAGGNGTSTNFATTFGTLSVSQFALATSIATGGFINPNAIQNFVTNWINFYTANPGATHGLSITLASYGAAFGDAVGVALLNPPPIGSLNMPATLPDARFNPVQNEVYNALKDNAEGLYQVGVEISALPPETPLQGEANSRVFVLTPTQDTFTGNGFDTIKGPLYGAGNPSLTDGDFLAFTGPNNLLKATFDGSAHAFGVNITGIQTWTIDNVDASFNSSTVIITGDSFGGNIISGLTTLNYNAHSGVESLFIGNNLQPVFETPGAFATTPFTINVIDAVGTGDNGVDVDFAASVFTGPATINVNATAAGVFPEVNGSFVFPRAIFEENDDCDPNWEGLLDNAFAIAAGASSGPNGAVGFTTWNVASLGAIFVGDFQLPFTLGNFVIPTGVNILALGGEGSTSATTLNLTDDGSSTILFATNISDSLVTDWENLTTIDLHGTSGFVVLTGAETDAFIDEENPDRVSEDQNDGGNSDDPDGFGLLTADTTALKTIVGGTGNSFYDLSSLTAATAQAASIDGGHSTKGNSEVAFNNDVLTGTKPVNITHISVLDDASDIQGGTIDMNNFAGLLPLNVDYTLLCGGTAPKGFQLLQLLDDEGSTETTLGSKLIIENGFNHFAINMQDMADGTLTESDDEREEKGQPFEGHVLSGFDITIFAGINLTPTNILDLWFSDDGITLDNTEDDDTGTAFVVPTLTIDNYTTVNIFLPFESQHDGGPKDQNWVVLGSTGFFDTPIVTALSASVNFFDNKADTGGSDPFADNLVLGHTNFTATLSPADIGVTTVLIDVANGIDPTIIDNGAGTFEIGATNASVLIASSTSHLIMDLPGTNIVLGINVTGSSTGQNLLQGTSGLVVVDHNGHDDGVTYESLDQTGKQGVGNDTLTGGAGKFGVANVDKNTGDNFFPEGGHDTVNIASNEAAQSTVWFAYYDVCNSGGPDFLGNDSFGDPYWGVGQLFEQAVTDLDPDNLQFGEHFVDGYGLSTSLLTINGFHFGTGGDTINFATSDWAKANVPKEEEKEPEKPPEDLLASITYHILGLVKSDGETPVPNPELLDPPHFATFVDVGTANTKLTIGDADVILDDIAPNYANAAALKTALLTKAVGNIVLFDDVDAHTEVDLLVAYNTTTGINIADVTLNNLGSGTEKTDTSEFTAATLQVHDLIHITTTLGLANFATHNIAFFL
jgi:hypothetical protein